MKRKLRYVDVDDRSAEVPREFEVEVAEERVDPWTVLPTEKIVCVETMKDIFGHATARVWIESSAR